MINGAFPNSRNRDATLLETPVDAYAAPITIPCGYNERRKPTFKHHQFSMIKVKGSNMSILYWDSGILTYSDKCMTPIIISLSLN